MTTCRPAAMLAADVSRAILRLFLACGKQAVPMLPHSLNVARRRQAAAFFLLGLPLRACPKPMALASSERRLA
jgi:hypothetical protein